MRLFFFFFAVTLLLLAACPSNQSGTTADPGPAGAQGPAGPQGPTGPQGPKGEVLITDGGVLVGPAGPAGASIVISAAGNACANGGVRVSLEDGGGAQVICNGASGPTGLNGSNGAAGSNGASVTVSSIDGGSCPYGGVRIESDGGAPQHVCNGAPGLSTSVVVTAVAVGDVNCLHGGTRFAVGTTLSYACNGAPGGVGPPGPVGGDAGFGSYASADGYAFAGFTVATYTGSMGGLFGANAKCDAEFSGSHLCTDREYEWIGGSTSVPIAGAWVDPAFLATTYSVFPRDRVSNSGCNNWRSDTAAFNAPFIDPSSGTITYSVTCANARPLSCCRSRTAWFRGFTTAAYSGNMGGLPGAHAKCNAEFSGSHVCTDREYGWAGSGTPVPTMGAWVDPAFLATHFNLFPRDRVSNSGCNNWRSNTTAFNAPFIDPSSGILTYSVSCASLRPLTCCGP